MKEEEIMDRFWREGPLLVKELLGHYKEPKPHFNAPSTVVQGLKEKGFLAHKDFGNSYRYYAVLTGKEHSNGTLKSVIAKYFDNSYLRVVSTLIEEEDISVDDPRKLIDDVEQGNRK